MTMEQNILDEVREIKKSLRLAMNGVVSTLQRRQGLDYKINFGVEIPRLKGIANAHKKNRELATTLWQDNIRECKMLAILLLPEEDYSAVADEWIAGTRFTEIADQLAMHILCMLPNAWERALRWSADNKDLSGYCGYMTISHLIRRGIPPTPQQEQAFFVNAITLGCDGEHSVTMKCALNAVTNYLDRSPGAAARLKTAIASSDTAPTSLESLIESFEE